jgi:hypothetical protein
MGGLAIVAIAARLFFVNDIVKEMVAFVGIRFFLKAFSEKLRFFKFY